MESDGIRKTAQNQISIVAQIHAWRTTQTEPTFSTTPPKRTADDLRADYGYIYVISNPAHQGYYKWGLRGM